MCKILEKTTLQICIVRIQKSKLQSMYNFYDARRDNYSEEELLIRTKKKRKLSQASKENGPG